MESWYFLIRVVGLLKSKCRQHFPTPPQLASPKLNLKLHSQAVLSLGPTALGCRTWMETNMGGNDSIGQCDRSGGGVYVCAFVSVSLSASVSVCGWLSSSSTCPGELWAVSFYFGRFHIGNQKGVERYFAYCCCGLGVPSQIIQTSKSGPWVTVGQCW